MVTWIATCCAVFLMTLVVGAVVVFLIRDLLAAEDDRGTRWGGRDQ